MRNRTCAWAPPWIPLLCQQTRGTVWLKRHDRMIDRAGPFIKPCAFTVLPGRESLPCHQCRTIAAAPRLKNFFGRGPKKFLPKGASYKPAHDGGGSVSSKR